MLDFPARREKIPNDTDPAFSHPVRTRTVPLTTHFLFATFVSLQVSSLWFHEPWADELQAWLLARDSGLWELLSLRLRGEVSPGLWHALLWVAARLTDQAAVVNILSSLIACVTCALILYRSPFPWLVRATLPFTYYFCYQYAVVARNYCLTSLCVTVAAATFQERMVQPWPYLTSLLLLANTSSHGLLMAIGLFLAELWPCSNIKVKAPLLKFSPLFVLGALTALAQTWPPPENYSFVSAPGGGSVMHDLRLWNAFDESFLSRPWLSLWAAGLSLMVFGKSGMLGFYLLPNLLIGLLFSRHWAYWHTGIPFLLWFFNLYQCYGNPSPHPVLRKPWWVLALGVLLGIQLAQTVQTVRRDISEPYFGLRHAAEDIRRLGIDPNEIALPGYYCQMLWAFFPPEAGSPKYFRWTVGAQASTATHDKPYVLAVVGQQGSRSPYRLPRLRNYRAIRIYPGTRPWKGRDVYRNNSFVLMRRIAEHADIRGQDLEMEIQQAAPSGWHPRREAR